MPGKQQEDWTDDAAFWDEAWGDMQQRLDAPAERRAVAWWYRPALLAVLLLVGASLAIIAYRATLEPTPAPVPKASPVAPQPGVAAAASPASATISEKTSTDGPETTTSPTPTSRQNATSPAKRTSRPGTPSLDEAVAVPGLRNPGIPSIPPTADTPKASGFAPAGNTPLPSSSALSPTSAIVRSPSPTERVPPTAVPLLASSSQLHPLEIATAPRLKEVVFRPTRRPGSLTLELGAIATPSLQKPGYTAGLAYRLPTRGRLELPLQLRYRRDEVQISSINERGLTANLGSVVTGGPISNAQSVENIFLDLQRAQLDALRTQGLEFVAGADYRLGSRWTLGVAGGLEYLLQAQGPVIFTDTLSNQAVFRGAGFEDLLVVDFAAADQSPVTGGTPEFNGGRNGGAVGSITRLVPRVYLRAGYQVTPRLGLYAGGSYLLGTVYQDGLGGLRREQVEVGLRWRVK